MVPDFSGFATKAGVKCSDGRTITPNAFSHMDGITVPLVWQHGHSSPENVLGHVVLHAVQGGHVRVDGFFNETKQGQNAKLLVIHKDIKALSIFANQIVEKAKQVLHGMIREVSLCLSGANPQAVIDFVQIQHSDGTIEDVADEAVISMGDANCEFSFTGQDAVDKITHAASSGASEQTVSDIYNTFTDDQKAVVNFMIGAALQAQAGDGTAQHSDGDPADDNKTSDDAGSGGEEGNGDVTHRNVFDKTGDGQDNNESKQIVLSHSDLSGIFAAAEKSGSLKGAIEGYAVAHGIENIGVLFPDAKTLGGTPEFNKRRTEWVAGVLNACHHSPFSRVKTVTADITQDEARARGYITGTYKKEEWFSVTKRTTTPTTVYKKQKLDRDDIVDITDFDVVAWTKGEMRLMLDEELATAILIGDGRDVDDEDKIKDPAAATDGAGLRSIYNEHELFKTDVWVNLGDANSSYQEVIEEVLRSRYLYKGTGTPTFYTKTQVLVEMLLVKDTTGRRLYSNVNELAAALMVDSIVTVETFDRVDDLVGIIVNLADYNIGADRGGEVNLFDDFDIDYNQYKYLMETRISGALTKILSALVIRNTSSSNVLVQPASITKPTFVSSTGVVTIPTVTGVVYKDSAGTTVTGAQTALDPGESATYHAVPASGYYFRNTGTAVEWTYKRPVS